MASDYSEPVPTRTLPCMSLGCSEQSYWYKPDVGKAWVTLSPGFMNWVSPLSSRRTEWVKLSLFVQVTVVPTGTVMSSGANLYDLGRSTWLVATGAVGAAAWQAAASNDREEDGECRAEGIPGTRANEGRHGGQRAARASAVIRRAAQVKMRMKARRSRTSLIV